MYTIHIIHIIFQNKYLHYRMLILFYCFIIKSIIIDLYYTYIKNMYVLVYEYI